MYLFIIILVLTIKGRRIIFIQHNLLSSTCIQKSYGNSQHITMSQATYLMVRSHCFRCFLAWIDHFWKLLQNPPKNNTGILISFLNRKIFHLLHCESTSFKIDIFFLFFSFFNVDNFWTTIKRPLIYISLLKAAYCHWKIGWRLDVSSWKIWLTAEVKGMTYNKCTKLCTEL